jgi:hypothetical protein
MKGRQVAPALAKLIRIRDKLANCRADHRANTRSAEPVGPVPGVELDWQECSAIIDLIDELGNPDILEKYWLKGAFFSRPQLKEKLAAIMWIALYTTPDKPPDDEMFEKIAEDLNLTDDMVKHAYRDFLLPLRTSTTSKKRLKGQSSNSSK